MKILFVSGGSRGAVFPLIPLATAARNAGHEVFVGVTDNTLPTVASAGLPGVGLTSGTMPQFMYKDRDLVPLVEPTDPDEWNLFNGHGMGRLAAASLPALVELINRWKPDLIVGGSLSYAAPIVAAKFGIPFVRQALNMGEPANIDLGAAAELERELAEYGFAEIPGEDLFIDICPPSVRGPEALPSQSMTYIPYNTHKPLEPWMYTRGDKPRVIVSAGSRVTADYELDPLRALVEKVAPLNLEMIIAVPDEVADALGPLPQDVRAGWLPVDVLMRSSDLLVHRAGGNTMLTAMTAGIPQLVIPAMPKQVGMTITLAEYGAAKMLLDGKDDSPENIADSCRELLEKPSYTERSKEIAKEIAALPSPHEVVGIIAKLVKD